MNKKFFSIRLMREGMRQVRLVGIIGLVFMIGTSFFTSFLNMIHNDNAVRYKEIISEADAIRYYELYEINPYIYIVMYAVAPIMVLMLFGFMNRRKSSDFYHVIPYTRACIYISFMTSVVAWCVLIIGAGVITTTVVIAVSKSTGLVMTNFPIQLMTAIAGALLSAAATGFAATLTGTYFTNVLTAGMLLIAPRGFILMCSRMLYNAMPFVPNSGNNFLLSANSNIPFGILFRIFIGSYDSGNTLFATWTPVIYTMIVAAVYGVGGILLFVKRKSEKATLASINRGLQCFLRIIPAMLISLIPIDMLFNIHTGINTANATQKFEIVMSYIAAVLAYFVYEVITTRKLRNVVKAIPGLVILIALNIILIFGLKTSYDYNMGMIPDKDELEYVIVRGPDNDMLWAQTSDIKLYSDDVKAIASDCLKDTISLWTNEKYGANGFYNKFHRRNCMTIEYHYTDGRSMSREVIVDNVRYSRMKKALIAEEDFAANLGSSLLDMNRITYTVGNLSNADYAEEVYEVFLSELNNMGSAKLMDLVDMRNDGDVLFEINVRDKFPSANGAFSNILIGPDMPRTVAAYANTVNREFPENELERFINTAALVKKQAEADSASGSDIYDESGISQAYMDANLSISIYTVNADGTIRLTDAYCSCYYDGDYGYVMDDESLESVAALAGLLQKVGMINSDDIKPGAMLLSTEYWECISEAAGHYYEDGSTVTKLAETKSSSDFGWYIVDESVEELIHDISRNSMVYYE